MSPWIALAAFFPVVHVVSFLSLLFFGVYQGSCVLAVAAFLHLYLTPPILFRLHSIFWPLQKGYSEFTFARYSPWFGSYNLQVLFIAVPHLEAVLRLVPGAYSAWMRLWGAKIGKGVFWTPLVEVIDRPLLNVGDHVVIGHRATFTCHFIVPKRGESGLRLYMAATQLGEHSFIGAGVRMGPGVTILPNSLIKYNMECWPDKTYGGKEEA